MRDLRPHYGHSCETADRAAVANLARAQRAEEVLRWLVSMDDPEGPGFEARRRITLTYIIERARNALCRCGPGGLTGEDIDVCAHPRWDLIFGGPERPHLRCPACGEKSQP